MTEINATTIVVETAQHLAKIEANVNRLTTELQDGLSVYRGIGGIYHVNASVKPREDAWSIFPMTAEGRTLALAFRDLAKQLTEYFEKNPPKDYWGVEKT